MNQEPSFDDVFEYLVRYLSMPNPAYATIYRPSSKYDYNVWLVNVVKSYCTERGLVYDVSEVEQYYLARPFYDAAWELCRIGVLRLGPGAPMDGQFDTPRRPLSGDGYSLTSFGREWVQRAAERPFVPMDPSRFAEVVTPFRERFGEGFMQRATEAARCYRTGNHLACCAMAGAAAESILLATAIARKGGSEVVEAQVLKEYRGGGYRKLVAGIVQGASRGLREHIELSRNLLAFWRNEASHGTATAITDFQGHASLTQLLQLAQLVSGSWATLARPASPSA